MKKLRLWMACLALTLGLSTAVYAEEPGTEEPGAGETSIEMNDLSGNTGLETPDNEVITITDPSDGPDQSDISETEESEFSKLLAAGRNQFSGMLGWNMISNYEHADAMHAVYAVMYDGLIHDKGPVIGIYSEEYPLTSQEASIVADAMFFDHPELIMFVDSGGFSIYESENGAAEYYAPRLSDQYASYAEAQDMIRRIDERVDPVVNEIIDSSINQYEIVQGVHDWLCKNIYYSLNANNCHNMVGTLLNGRGVCDGYAHAFQYLLRKCGVESYVVTGMAGEAHAWNLVKIDGQWSWFDVTWDDQGYQETDIFYAYFGMNDSIMSEDHTPFASENEKDYYRYLPAVSSLDHAYHTVNNSFVTNNAEVDDIAPLFKNGFAKVYVKDKADEAFSFWFGRHFNELLEKLGMVGEKPVSVPRLSHEIHYKITNKVADITWDLTPEGVLTIEGTGDMPDIYYNQPWELERSFIYKVVIGEGITSISDYAFSGCVSLTDVSVPSTVKRIGKEAFVRCSSIVSIDLPSGLQSIGDTAFAHNISLTSLSLPASVTMIGKSAFLGCINLNEVTIPENRGLEMGEGVFSGCDSLKKVSYLSTLENWMTLQFADIPANPLNYNAALFIDGNLIKDLVIPEGTKRIGVAQFAGCGSISTVTVPDSVISLGTGCFWLCNALTEVSLGKSLEKIGSRAFESCHSLNSINFPEKVYRIGRAAFDGCHELLNVELPESLIEIHEAAFRECYAFTEFVIPASVTLFGDYVLDDCSALTSIEVDAANKYYQSEDGLLYTKDKSELLRCPEAKIIENFVMPDTILAIHAHAFRNCYNLVNLRLPASIESISEQQFYGCTSLKSVIIPDTVVSIAEGAFYYCVSLESIRIPDKVISISADTFAGCYSLEYVYFPAGMREFSNNIFGDELPHIRAISFGGSKEQWDKIAKGVNPILTSGDIPIYFGQKSGTNGTSWYWFLCADDCLVIYGSGEIPALTGLDMSKIKEVVIHKGITSVGEGAFANCSALTKITLPSSLTEVKDNAFANCDTLEVVYYGTEEQWNSIVIGKNNEALTAGNRLSAVSGKLGDNISWTLTSDHRMIIQGGGYVNVLSARGEEKFRNYQNEVQTLIVEPGVTGIGPECFRNMENLELVFLPEGLEEIDWFAFDNCPKLSFVQLPKTLKKIDSDAFYECFDLSDIELPDGLTEIGSSAFAKCRKLKSIQIPESVTSIGMFAFSECNSLEKANIPAAVSEIPMFLFNDCFALEEITIPESVTVIGNRAFYGCKALKNRIVIPESVTSLGQDAFYECESLTDLEIKAPLTEIGEGTFAGCRGLTAIDLPETVTSLGLGAFGGCAGLTVIDLPDGIKEMGISVFADCVNLTSVKLPVGLTEIPDGAFARCFELVDITIPDSVTRIGNNAFSDCSSLERISIPDSVTVIDEGTFAGCSSLTDVVLPDTITEIGVQAFYYCNSLTSMKLPDSVTKIGDSAFGSCEELVTVEIPKSVNEIGRYVFMNCPKLETIYFGGTEDEWETLVADVDISLPYRTTVICNYVPCDHIPVAHPATKPTCTTEGNIAYWSCEKCSCFFSDAECTRYISSTGMILPMTDHKIVSLPDKPATCTETGLTGGRGCAVCGTVLEMQTVIPATGHNYVVVDPVEATCETPGHGTAVQCSNCETYLLAPAETPALGHIGGQVTCQNQAICERCGNPYGDLAPHSFTEKIIDKEHQKTEPADGSAAEYYKSCTCGAKGDATFAVPLVRIIDENGVMKATINLEDRRAGEVFEMGMILGNASVGDAFTLESKGRRDIKFTLLDGDSYSLDTTGLGNVACRAYVFFRDQKGNKVTAYSDVIRRRG